MCEAMECKHLLGPMKKLQSSKKRNNELPTDDTEHPVRKQVVVGPSMKISVASQVVVSGLAIEEAKSKLEMSDAAKSWYGYGTKK